MAIKKIIEIDVDVVRASGGLKKFTQSLKDTEKQGESLRSELKRLKQQLAELPEGSEEYNKIANRAGEVSDKIGDISTKIKNLGSDTKNIDAVVQGAQTLSGAFSVASSASALLGSENKDLQEQMLKVESAIGLTVGIQSISNALQKESALYIGLTSVATKIQTGLQVAYAAVVGTTTGALKALKIALVSTGVGALVVGLGLLISKLSESAESTEDLESAQKSLNDELERSKDLYSESAKNVDFITKVKVLNAKIAGKSELDLQTLEKDGIDKKRKLILEENIELEKQLNNKKISAEQSKKIISDIYSNEKQYKDLGQQLTLSDLEFQNTLADKKRESQKKFDENARAKREKQEQDRKAELERIYLLEQAYLKKRNDAELEALDLADKIKKENEDRLKTDKQKKLDDEQIAFEANKLKIENDLIDEATKKAALEELEKNHLNNINDINLEADNIKYDNDKKAAEKALEDAAIVAANKEAQLQSNIANLQNILSIGGSKLAKIQKALAITEIVRDTIRAVNAATGNEIKVPAFIGVIPNPVKPASMISTALGIGSAIAKGAASIAAITSDSKSVSNSGGAAGGAGGGGNAPAAPQFNLVGQSSTNQLASTIAGQQNKPLQTYVVGNQITTQQSLDRNAVQTSTFG